MKIDEFIKEVNEHDGMQAKKVDKKIFIGIPNNMGVLFIPEDATNFMEIDTLATINSMYWKKADCEYLSSLIEELLHTPIKERFSEKKYCLATMRYIEGPIATKQYVTSFYANGDCMKFNFGSKEYAHKFTDEDLSILSEWFPKEAFDAMKEPVEDE